MHCTRTHVLELQKLTRRTVPQCTYPKTVKGALGMLCVPGKRQAACSLHGGRVYCCARHHGQRLGWTERRAAEPPAGAAGPAGRQAATALPAEAPPSGFRCLAVSAWLHAAASQIAASVRCVAACCKSPLAVLPPQLSKKESFSCHMHKLACFPLKQLPCSHLTKISRLELLFNVRPHFYDFHRAVRKSDSVGMEVSLALRTD